MLQTSQVEDIIPFRSTAHLPPTAAQPHVAPHKKQLQRQAQRAAEAAASGSSTSSESSEARAKKSPGGVKAKASTKQKKRNSKALERGAEFAEKLEFKAKEVEGRKVSSTLPFSFLEQLLTASRPRCDPAEARQGEEDLGVVSRAGLAISRILARGRMLYAYVDGSQIRELDGSDFLLLSYSCRVRELPEH